MVLASLRLLRPLLCNPLLKLVFPEPPDAADFESRELLLPGQTGDDEGRLSQIIEKMCGWFPENLGKFYEGLDLGH